MEWLRGIAGVAFLFLAYSMKSRDSEERPWVNPKLPETVFLTENGHAITFNKGRQEFFCDGKELATTRPWTAGKAISHIQDVLLENAPLKMKPWYHGCFHHERTLREETFTDGPEAIYYNPGHFKATFDPEKSTMTFSIRPPKARRVGGP
jgi:hypothetical protein